MCEKRSLSFASTALEISQIPDVPMESIRRKQTKIPQIIAELKQLKS